MSSSISWKVTLVLGLVAVIAAVLMTAARGGGMVIADTGPITRKSAEHCLDTMQAVSEASGRLALARMGGSPYLAAKVGPTPASEAEVQAAQARLDAARAALDACRAVSAAGALREAG